MKNSNLSNVDKNVPTPKKPEMPTNCHSGVSGNLGGGCVISLRTQLNELCINVIEFEGRLYKNEFRL
ncbi:hypothetical protein PGT21_003090 [Puccinia graminis f. sp. tritici]|uniref:Uncharacterized protein n=1 Tax=Puccinia graminis f. sp. tritici TaxID=56615 RepID=A0A5B0N1P4_PUCGR|nr:hypothetical protein PGT21_003090 [Puccinia graminis f. sp. tritici]KAA1082344.1 hypothetical protein PGTUg99_033990 [Puccinia graminis f. sp. tritici]